MTLSSSMPTNLGSKLLREIGSTLFRQLEHSQILRKTNTDEIPLRHGAKQTKR